MNYQNATKKFFGKFDKCMETIYLTNDKKQLVANKYCAITFNEFISGLDIFPQYDGTGFNSASIDGTIQIADYECKKTYDDSFVYNNIAKILKIVDAIQPKCKKKIVLVPFLDKIYDARLLLQISWFIPKFENIATITSLKQNAPNCPNVLHARDITALILPCISRTAYTLECDDITLQIIQMLKNMVGVK